MLEDGFAVQADSWDLESEILFSPSWKALIWSWVGLSVEEPIRVVWWKRRACCWKLTRETTEEDEATASPAPAEGESEDAAVAAVLSEPGGIFKLKEEQVQAVATLGLTWGDFNWTLQRGTARTKRKPWAVANRLSGQNVIYRMFVQSPSKFFEWSSLCQTSSEGSFHRLICDINVSFVASGAVEKAVS